MRNPDKWLPDDSPQPQIPNSRRAALMGLLVVLFLLIGGLVLTHILGRMTKLQDCALSGRSNCEIQP